MTIGVINPQSGNITSMCDTLDRLNRPYHVLSQPDLDGISQILLPGQGRFGAVMQYLRENHWVPVLRDWAAQDKPILGICVGMQVMFEASDEDPDVEGLGIFDGKATLLDSPKQPMIGWAGVHWLMDGYPTGSAYFVNSYVVTHHHNSIAITEYGQRFCAAVARDNVIGFQFHPEKSGEFGKELLQKCLIS